MRLQKIEVQVEINNSRFAIEVLAKNAGEAQNFFSALINPATKITAKTTALLREQKRMGKIAGIKKKK